MKGVKDGSGGDEEREDMKEKRGRGKRWRR